jgi:ketosteroid isomerase-like protein
MSDPDIAAIREIEKRRCTALVDVDLATLDDLFSDRLSHVHATGLVQGKAEFLAGLAERRPFLKVERGPLDIRVFGDCAVMTGTMVNTGRSAGAEAPPVRHAYATQVLAREGGRWRYVAFQATSGPKLPEHVPAGE